MTIPQNGVSTNPSSRLLRKPVVFGCSFLLTAAGQSRLRTGFPLTFPWERHQQAPHNIKCCISAVNQNVGVKRISEVAVKHEPRVRLIRWMTSFNRSAPAIRCQANQFGNLSNQASSLFLARSQVIHSTN
jgi:hypothetical protein